MEVTVDNFDANKNEKTGKIEISVRLNIHLPSGAKGTKDYYKWVTL